MKLIVHSGVYSVCQLAPDASIPAIANVSGLLSITRTRDELSIVCESQSAPTDCRARQNDFRVLEVEGPLDFSMTGVLSKFLSPLAASQISVFTISTYNTDYVLLRSHDLDRAIGVLDEAGIECNRKS